MVRSGTFSPRAARDGDALSLGRSATFSAFGAADDGADAGRLRVMSPQSLDSVDAAVPALKVKKTVSFRVEDFLFSEDDYASALSIQEEDVVDSEDEQLDYARTLADLSWMLLWGASDDGVVDHAAAYQLAEKGKMLGCLWSKGALALCYLCGWGVEQDTDLAMFLAAESATTGYGQFCIGYAHFLGIGVDQTNYVQALKHLAFIKGNAIAQFHVAQMLEMGQGIVRSKSRAIKWYSMAAAAGHQASVVRLQFLNQPLNSRPLSPAAMKNHDVEFLSTAHNSASPSLQDQVGISTKSQVSTSSTLPVSIDTALKFNSGLAIAKAVHCDAECDRDKTATQIASEYIYLNLDEMRRNPPHERYVLRKLAWATGSCADAGLHRNSWMPPQSDLSSDAYRSFVRDSQTSVPIPSGADMNPVSIGIPKENCLLPCDMHPSWLRSSTCAHTTNVGSHPLFHESLQLRVLGCDVLLRKSDEVARFLLTHARKPRLEVLIKGYHVEWDNNFDGKAFSSQVIDWSCRMDITDACCDRWSFISASEGSSFASVISAYRPFLPSKFCDSKAPVKSLAMQCVVEWNWDELRAALERLVLSTGWNGMYSITFPRVSPTVVGIISDNRSTRLVTSAAFRGVCAVSFLWIVAWPLYSCIKHGGQTAALTAHYSMACSWAEFFGKNCRQIRRAICKREISAVLRLNPKSALGGVLSNQDGAWVDGLTLPRIGSAVTASASKLSSATPRHSERGIEEPGDLLPRINLHHSVQQKQQVSRQPALCKLPH